jgi:Flp pilus assembly protein TadG
MKSKSGQSLIETALVLLMVMTALFGIIEIARMMLTYTTLADAARAGVRYAIVHGGERTCGGACDSDGPSGPDANPANVVAVVQNILSAATLPLATSASCPASAGAAGIVVTYPDGQNTVNSRVQVTACYGYAPMVSFLPFTSAMKLSSTTLGTISY